MFFLIKFLWNKLQAKFNKSIAEFFFLSSATQQINSTIYIHEICQVLIVYLTPSTRHGFLQLYTRQQLQSEPFFHHRLYFCCSPSMFLQLMLFFFDPRIMTSLWHGAKEIRGKTHVYLSFLLSMGFIKYIRFVVNIFFLLYFHTDSSR